MNPNPHGGRRIELEKAGKRVRADFSANLNPWGPPESLRRGWEKLWALVEVYPPLDLEFYRERIAHLYGFPPSFLFPCNGATQGIYLLSRVLSVRRVLILEPLFTEYARAFRLAGKKVFSFPLFPTFHPEKLWEVLEKERIEALIFGNPSNPLGEAEGVFLYHRLRETPDFRELLVLVDEAFQEFLGEKSSLSPWVFQDPYLYLIRSLTKYYALPGLRGGFIFTHPQNVERLEGYFEPWSLNGILAGALDILAGEDLSAFHRTSRENLLREKEFLEANFKRWEFLEYFPSWANFYTLRVKKEQEAFFRFLWEEGVVVRRLLEFFGLGEEFFRIAVRRREENQLFCEVVERFWKG